jgi:hypothetical protein
MSVLFSPGVRSEIASEFYISEGCILFSFYFSLKEFTEFSQWEQVGHQQTQYKCTPSVAIG